jgi:hypothetical protein
MECKGNASVLFGFDYAHFYGLKVWEWQSDYFETSQAVPNERSKTEF